MLADQLAQPAAFLAGEPRREADVAVRAAPAARRRRRARTIRSPSLSRRERSDAGERARRCDSCAGGAAACARGAAAPIAQLGTVGRAGTPGASGSRARARCPGQAWRAAAYARPRASRSGARRTGARGRRETPRASSTASSPRARSGGSATVSTLSRNRRSCAVVAARSERGEVALVDPTTRTSGVAHERAADRAVLLVLQEAQHRDLATRAQRLELVEEQRAAARLRDQSLPRLARVGERAARVAEELALEQRVGDRAAVDRDERPAAPRRSGSGCARATSSLPVPVSPWIRTVAGHGAKRWTSAAHLEKGRRFAQQVEAREGVVVGMWSHGIQAQASSSVRRGKPRPFRAARPFKIASAGESATAPTA